MLEFTASALLEQRIVAPVEVAVLTFGFSFVSFLEAPLAVDLVGCVFKVHGFATVFVLLVLASRLYREEKVANSAIDSVSLIGVGAHFTSVEIEMSFVGR